ncbi:hypothetical protein A6769_27425 [Nostoc punctiforme NIES-2108]|uniref:Uncharacterized protein n=1 Tax=Nostoc punctiforme NIES-2108 TaxID=1356359 RepID=A0A367R7X5_NOSPU|nr:hypothetical protein A6769_27425 [Nostoc punctiforme NIES-2108]
MGVAKNRDDSCRGATALDGFSGLKQVALGILPAWKYKRTGFPPHPIKPAKSSCKYATPIFDQFKAAYSVDSVLIQLQCWNLNSVIQEE